MDFTELRPGRELDALVAERVFGYERMAVPPDAEGQHGGGEMLVPPGGLPPGLTLPPKGPIGLAYMAPCYSTELVTAWTVAEKLRMGLIKTDDGWMAFIPHRDIGWLDELAVDISLEESAEAPTAPHAICLVALKTMEGR